MCFNACLSFFPKPNQIHKLVKVSNDQELVKSELKSNPKNPSGKKNLNDN